MTSLLLDVVVPVHDEESVLATSVRRLHEHLSRAFPAEFRITIADNASTDRTAEVAAALAIALPEVRSLRLEEKGRGRALKAAWSASRADVVAYMDVDLSTDLTALPALVEPLLADRADVAIGSRLAPGAEVERGLRREVISRCYNRILQAALSVGVADAQCGFKAVRADVARDLLPRVRDGGWFFDTELLVLAERSGYRVLELPVAWHDDPDSSVALARTALDDLRGIARLRRDLPRHLPSGPGDLEANPPARVFSQLWRFAGVGAVSTVVHLGLFLALAASLWADQVANVVALLVATVFNTAANRWFTFGVRGRARLGTHHLQALVIFAITWGLSSLALVLLGVIDPGAGTHWQTGAIAMSNVTSTALRFVALRSWVFRPRPPGLERPTAPEGAQGPPELPRSTGLVPTRRRSDS